MLTSEQIKDQLYISENDTKDAIKVKLLLATILNQGVDITVKILKEYSELARIMKIE